MQKVRQGRRRPNKMGEQDMLSVKAKELEKAQKRLADLDKLFRKAFEQLALENMSEA